MNAVSEQLNSQRPLGAHWNAFPGISAYGVLRRSWRINQLHRSEVRATLGVGVARDEDLFLKSLHSQRLKDRLAEVYPDVDRGDWDLTTWWPFAGPFPKIAYVAWLRECPSCARTCYHSLLFQMPGITHCPWHGDALTWKCPRCDRRLQAGLTQNLPPGRCTCGHDLVEEVATVLGDPHVRASSTIIDRYKSWAQGYRNAHWLVPPESMDSEADSALAALVGRDLERLFPSQRRSGQTGVVLDAVFASPWNERAPLHEKSGLERYKPTTAFLPAAWNPPMRKITEAVNEMLSPKAREELMRASSPMRTVVGQWPTNPLGSLLILQTECLDRVVQRCLTRLASTLRRMPPGARRFPDAAGLGERVEATLPLSAVLVERVLQRVLLRGYADGVRIALGRHMPGIYDRGRPRPVRRFPWVELNLEAGEAKIAWSRQPGAV